MPVKRVSVCPDDTEDDVPLTNVAAHRIGQDERKRSAAAMPACPNPMVLKRLTQGCSRMSRPWESSHIEQLAMLDFVSHDDRR
jgi:hypothetical protein